jgi:hypothetical protein
MSSLPILARDKRLNIIDQMIPVVDYAADMKRDARSARRFILGDDASYEVGRWIAACEDILLDNIQFARPPFDTTYVELTVPEVHRGLGRHTSGPAETADDRLGFLIKGNHVRCVVSIPPERARPLGMRAVGPGAWEYWVNTPEDDYGDFETLEKAEWSRLALLLGSSLHSLKDEEQRHWLAFGTRLRSTILTNETLTGNAAKIQMQLRELAISAAGEMRTLWAVLLLINQHRHRLRFSEVSRHVSFTPQRKVYAGHTLVSIPMSTSSEQTRRTYYPNTRASPVGHEVRGHWRHWHISEQCLHEWPLVPDELGHFACAFCRGWRTWCKPHRRGDSSRGTNIQTWEVTP